MQEFILYIVLYVKNKVCYPVQTYNHSYHNLFFCAAWPAFAHKCHLTWYIPWLFCYSIICYADHVQHWMISNIIEIWVHIQQNCKSNIYTPCSVTRNNSEMHSTAPLDARYWYAGTNQINNRNSETGIANLQAQLTTLFIQLCIHLFIETLNDSFMRLFVYLLACDRQHWLLRDRLHRQRNRKANRHLGATR